MADLPLHVQTALALGWTEPHDRGDGKWFAKKPKDDVFSDVPAFDTTWCHGGPLIPNNVEVLFKSAREPLWIASDGVLKVAGDTALQAVCRFVVAKGEKNV